jgi:hypothetical protein
MAKTAIPLQDLAQRIRQQQAELEKLRREYDARQAQMRELTNRKEQLQAQLRQVEAEIRGLDQGGTPAPRPGAAKPGAKPTAGVSLGELLVRIVTEAAGPVRVKELADEVVRRKFPTTSKNVPALVDNRVYELVKKGSLYRVKDQPGVVAAKPPVTPKAPAAKPKAPTAGPPVAAASGPSLQAVITTILAKAPHPLPARELAAKVLEAGYQTKSKDFTNVISAGVGKMADVENVPGKGYRLKRGKGKGAPPKA